MKHKPTKPLFAVNRTCGLILCCLLFFGFGRNFDGTATNSVELGDVTAARFAANVAWTALAFFRIAESNADDRCIISKFASSTGARQISIRTNDEAAPTGVEVWNYNAGNNLVVAGNGEGIELDTWYMVAVANDGTAGASGMSLYVIDVVAGTFIDDAVTGTYDQTVATQTAPIVVGTTDNQIDPMNGDVAYVAYVNKEMTKPEIIEYYYNPVMAVAGLIKDTVSFFLPLNGVDSPEFDLSDTQNNGTINGTVAAAANPPISLMPAFSGWPGFTAAAGAPASPSTRRRVVMNYLKNKRTE